MHTYQLPPTVDSVLLTNQENIYYLTGFASSTSEREAFLLITKGKSYLCTYRMFEQAAVHAASQSADIECRFILPDYPFSQLMKELIENHAIQSLGIEPQSLLCNEFQLLQKTLPKVKFIDTEQWIEPKRMIKSSQEIDSIREACQATDAVFKQLHEHLKAGLSEADLALEIEIAIKRLGCQVAFPPIVAFNHHASVPHHIPTHDMPLENGTLILLDFGAKTKGYCADITRVIFFGEAKNEWKQAYKTVKMAYDAAVTYISTETSPTGKTAHEEATRIVTQAGYQPFPHGVGHGVGLAVHEDPRLSQTSSHVLQTNMVFTIEPGIYMKDSFGIRLEDTFLKTPTGLEALTTSSFYDFSQE